MSSLKYQQGILGSVRFEYEFNFSINRAEQDGDWYIYTLFLAYENPKKVHKNTHKSSKNFKPSVNNVVSTRMNFAKNMPFYVPIGCARFARYCGKMCSRHFFP